MARTSKRRPHQGASTTSPIEGVSRTRSTRAATSPHRRAPEPEPATTSAIEGVSGTQSAKIATPRRGRAAEPEPATASPIEGVSRTRSTKAATPRRQRAAEPEPAGIVATPAPDASAPPERSGEPAREHLFPEEAVIELANCVWYLKTRYFRRQWQDEDGADPDARTRHALGRLDRAIRALDKAGITLVDPTGTRYPPGSEAMMTPLQFEPTAGVSTDTVSQTARPMVFRGKSLIQRGEVFVSVPLRQEASPDDGKPRK